MRTQKLYKIPHATCLNGKKKEVKALLNKKTISRLKYVHQIDYSNKKVRNDQCFTTYLPVWTCGQHIEHTDLQQKQPKHAQQDAHLLADRLGHRAALPVHLLALFHFEPNGRDSGSVFVRIRTLPQIRVHLFGRCFGLLHDFLAHFCIHQATRARVQCEIDYQNKIPVLFQPFQHSGRFDQVACLARLSNNSSGFKLYRKCFIRAYHRASNRSSNSQDLVADRLRFSRIHGASPSFSLQLGHADQSLQTSVCHQKFERRRESSGLKQRARISVSVFKLEEKYHKDDYFS